MQLPNRVEQQRVEIGRQREEIGRQQQELVILKSLCATKNADVSNVNATENSGIYTPEVYNFLPPGVQPPVNVDSGRAEQFTISGTVPSTSASDGNTTGDSGIENRFLLRFGPLGL